MGLGFGAGPEPNNGFRCTLIALLATMVPGTVIHNYACAWTYFGRFFKQCLIRNRIEKRFCTLSKLIIYFSENLMPYRTLINLIVYLSKSYLLFICMNWLVI